MREPVIREYLALERCPHCSVDKPNLTHQERFETKPGKDVWRWGIYVCQRCKYPVVAGGPIAGGRAFAHVIVPMPSEVDDAIPETARCYLEQARDALCAPDGATMLAASAVDALLKAKRYTNGSLYERIKQAAADHVITEAMAAWAHHVRLDANDPRHVDAVRPHVTQAEAKQTLEFALALAQFLFVLPARVARGRKVAGETPTDEGSPVKRTKRL